MFLAVDLSCLSCLMIEIVHFSFPTGPRPAQHPIHNPQKMPAKWSLSLNSAIQPLTSLPRHRVAVTLIPILPPPGRFALLCYLLEPLLPALG